MTDDHFWQIIESVFPSRARLESRLDELSKKELLSFAAHIFEATDEVRAKWEGPHIDDEIGGLSEDSTEDLTEWIVSQGRTFWQPLVGADDEALRSAFWTMHEVGASEEHPRRWATPHGLISLNGMVYVHYTDRFDDDFHDALQEHFDE